MLKAVQFGNDPDSCKPNTYLYSFLKYYLKYLKKQIQDKKAGTSKKELEMLGLLLWNYFFSYSTLNPDSKVVQNLRKNALVMEEAEFAVEFTGNKEITNYKLLPWELLFWVTNVDELEAKGGFLFNKENIRLIRKGSKLQNVRFRLNPDTSQIRILFCVSGLPEGVSTDDEVKEDEKNKEQAAYKPLKYKGALNALKEHCRNVKSQLLVKINGLPEEFYENGMPTERDDEKKYFDVTRLEECIRDFKPHVVHLITHGECDENGKLEMVFNHGAGGLKVGWKATAEFESIFKNISDKDNKPKLVFLQVCQSGQSDLPIELSVAGVPAVIAMFYDINQDTANEFAESFYEKLLGEKIDTVCDAFHKSRLLCWKKMDQEQLDFGLPIIYYNIENDQPLITEELYSKSKPQEWAEKLKGFISSPNPAKTSGDTKGPSAGSDNEIYVKLKRQAKRLLEEEIDLMDDANGEDANKQAACAIMEEAIRILFADYLPGREYESFKTVLESVVKEYNKTGDRQRFTSSQTADTLPNHTSGGTFPNLFGA